MRWPGAHAAATAVAAVFLAAAAVEAIASPVVGRVSDRLGRALPIRIGLSGVVVACVVLSFADGAALLLALAAVGGAEALQDSMRRLRW